MGSRYEHSSISRTLWITRHGMRQDFIDRHWRATAARPHDTPLAREGLRQAAETGQRLKTENIALIYASPFLRAVQTADIIAGILGLKIKIEHGICEALKPEWFPREPDFIPVEQLQGEYSSIDLQYRPLLRPVYPEVDDKTTFARCKQAVHAILDHSRGNVLLVGHGASIEGVVTGLTASNKAMNCRLCALNQLVQDQRQGWRLIYSGTEHLSIQEDEVRFH